MPHRPYRNRAGWIVASFCVLALAGCGSTAAVQTTPTLPVESGLTGIGATKASFTSAHRVSLAGCPAGTCFGPTVHTGAGAPYQFKYVLFGHGRIIGYTEAFASGTSLASAEAKVLAGFPSDTLVGHTGIIENGANGQSCRWVDVSSATLGKVFGGRSGLHKLSASVAKYLKSIGYSPDQMTIELATDDASGNWTYVPSDINQAVVSVGWHAKGNGC